jgi:serpin B
LHRDSRPLFALSLLLPSLAGCGSCPEPASPAPAPAAEVQESSPRSLAPPAEPASGESSEAVDLLAANYAFAIRLYRELAGGADNFVFSPYSIQETLALSYAGAAGATQREMAGAGHLPADPHVAAGAFAAQHANWQRAAASDTNQETHLRQSVGLFHHETFSVRESFRDLATGSYGARVEGLDFRRPLEACKVINQWVADATRGKVPVLLEDDALSEDVRTVIVSALYFKARWAEPFSEPRPGTFQLEDGTAIRVPMMSRETPVRHVFRPDVHVLELEYRSEGYSFLVIMPPKGQSLALFEEDLNDMRLLSWTAFLPRHEIDVVMPPFQIGPTVHPLRPHLEALGMHLAFDQKLADFSATGPEHLYVDDVYHGALIEVDRYGTVAAAATAEVRMRVSARRPTFEVNRPFLFLIRDNRSGMILFMGRVLDPRAALG